MNDLEWDEDRTGNRSPRSLVSLPDNHPFFLATSKAIDWTSCGDEDVGRVVTPSVFLEKLLRYAPVQRPRELKGHAFLSKTISLNFMRGGLGLLIDQGLLEEEDDEDNEDNSDSFEFESATDLQDAADKLVKELKDEPDLAVDSDSFEWVEGFEEHVQAPDARWIKDLTLEELTDQTNNLKVYVDLAVSAPLDYRDRMPQRTQCPPCERSRTSHTPGSRLNAHRAARYAQGEDAHRPPPPSSEPSVLAWEHPRATGTSVLNTSHKAHTEAQSPAFYGGDTLARLGRAS